MELRNTFVGLGGDNWGKVILGKIDTPYKTATAKLDIFSDTIADYNNIIGSHLGYSGSISATYTRITANGAALSGVGLTSNVGQVRQQTFNARPNQVVAYETPNFNGFKAQIARGSAQSVNAGASKELEAWSAMGMYDQGPFFASLAYEVWSNGADSTGASNIASGKGGVTIGKERIDAWKAGLGYTFGDSQVGFVYEDINHDDNTAIGKKMSRNAFWLGASQKFGANVLKAAYGKAGDSDVAGGNDGANNWSIGVDHNFSKRTKAYAIYTQMNNDANANYALDSEDGAKGYASTNGKDVGAFSVGIVHSF
jgi:predicted porin